MNPRVIDKRYNRLTKNQRKKVIEIYNKCYAKLTNWVAQVVKKAASLNIQISKTGVKKLVAKWNKHGKNRSKINLIFHRY
jgi:hypothetical protein